MGRKGIKKQFWMSKELAEELEWKATKACLTESALIRMLISGYHPPEAPGDDFFMEMNKLIAIAENLYLKAETERDPEVRRVLFDTSMDLKKLSLEIRRRYLTGEREAIKWL